MVTYDELLPGEALKKLQFKNVKIIYETRGIKF